MFVSGPRRRKHSIGPDTPVFQSGKATTKRVDKGMETQESVLL